MEKKNNCVKVGFSRILWGVMAILLCAAPCTLATDYTIDDVVTDPIFLYSGDMLKLLPGGYINNVLYAYSGSIVNINGGGVKLFLSVSAGANVTVYGTAFSVDGVPLDQSSSQFTPDPAGSVLTGIYDNDNDDPIDLLFYSDIPINLVNTAGGEPLEAQLWVFPSLINRYGRLSKIWAIVRLPEGITKEDIGSQPLVLNPGGIEAACQYAFQWYEEGTVRTSIIASFDKASLTATVPNGELELEVVGGLNTGQDFYGTDTIRIVSWYWRRR